MSGTKKMDRLVPYNPLEKEECESQGDAKSLVRSIGIKWRFVKAIEDWLKQMSISTR